MPRPLLLAVVALLAFPAAVSHAQDASPDKGNARITVLDPDGKPVEGAEVVLQKSNRIIMGPKSTSPAPRPFQTMRTIARATTDKDGVAEFKSVPADRYRAAAQKVGLGRGASSIVIDKDKTAELRINLQKPTPQN